jgi:TP901 family phage tail tape measure protein
MAEENVIQTNIVAKSDMSPLIADLNRVTSSLALLQERLNNTNKGLATQAAAINRTFSETLRSTGQFSTHFVSLSSDVDKFGTQLDKGQLKLSQFFRVYGDHAKTSGGLIRDLARQQVQLQNSILQPLGRNAEGLMQYNVHIPRGLDLTKNKMGIMRQEMQILNKVVQEGAGQLINWGKNTQWAGRQLTVGLTVPMAAFGKAAADAFKAADEQLVRLTKVYGGLSATSSAELAKVRKDVTETAAQLAKSYGASFKDTLALAGDIAATGKQGNELLGSIQETTRLSVLGEVDRQDAMKATLAIQTAFKQNTEELTESINFLNAVENQTSTTLNDLVEAIPKAGPVVKGLGGDVQDLALYLTAMREGGINASEGANALKSGLASLINPTKVATDMFKGFGIDIKNIVTSNAGNLTATILDLQKALDTLDPLQKQQAIEQLFGKFQFARMNALFENLGKQGSQTLQVLDLMKASSQDLANIAGRELAQVTESASGKYKRAVEGLKADLAGIGDQFLKINTTLINVVDSVIKFVDKLPQPLKQALAFMGMLTATAGPLIMLAGVLGNFFGYIIKGVYHFKALFKGAEGWKLLTPEILAANKAGDMAEQTFYDDARAAAILRQALDGLISSYTKLEAKAHSASVATNPTITTVAGSHVIGGRQVNPTSPYTGEKDTRAFSHVRPVATMTDEQKGNQTFFGVVPGSEAVNQKIGPNPQVYMEDDLPKIAGVTSIKGVSTGIVAEEAAKWHAMTAALAMQSQSEIKSLKREVGATGLVTTELSTSYQALLPQMMELTKLAANESALIVAQLEAGKLTVDQARAKIMALNAQIEAMMVQTATQTATGLGRTLDVTKVPLLQQPVVDPNTGKSNMKELLKKGRTRNLVTAIAQALGVKTYGAPYSIETTIPKRLNSGGDVRRFNRGGDVRGFDKGGNVERFGRNRTVVSGPSSIGYDDRYGEVPLNGYVLNQGASLDPRNKDLVAAAPSTFNAGGATMTAMLTPKETIFGPGIHKNPALYAAVDAANNGYAFGGNILPFKKNYGRLSAQLMKLIASGKGKDAILNYQDKILMQAGTARASAKTIDEMLGIPLPKGDTYDHLGHIITAGGSRIVGKIAKPASGIFADKESFEKYNKILSGRGLEAADVDGYLKGLLRFGGGKVVGSTSRLLRGLPERIINPKVAKEIEDKISAEYLRRVNRMKEDGILLTDSNNPYHEVSSEVIAEHFDTNPALRDVWSQWKTKTSAVNKHYFSELTKGRGASTNAASDIKILDPITGEEINLGKLVGSDEDGSKFYHSTNKDWEDSLAKLNMGGGIIDPKRKNYGVPQLGAKVIDRLTKKWKPQMQFREPGYQYTLGNQDPLHGPLQIGRTMVPKNRQDDYGWTREVLYQDDRFARQNVMPQFPIGDLEERGKYILHQYMSGNYGMMQQPGAYEALKALRRKFTGKLYRGVTLTRAQKGGMAPLPQEIIDAIQLARSTGDVSSLIGKEFIMRRSSWSKNSNIASYFAPGHHVSQESVLIEASVKNRNIIPAGDIFPDLRFPAPYGQKRANLPEEEAIFGGKFRILGFENGKLQVETVVDGARAMGGPVSSGRSYIVGEKGPEVFVPKANGSIVPNYALGGDIRYGKNSYGEQAPVSQGPRMGMKRSMGMTLLSMLPDYAGFEIGKRLTGGSMGGGLAGGMVGNIVGAALLNKFMFAADGATKKVSLLTRAWQLFTKAPGPLKVVAAVAAVAGSIKLINDKIMEHRKIINLAYGQTSETAKKIGDNFQFKSLAQQLKEARSELKAFNDSMTIAGSGDKKMNIGQLMFKAEDIKKEIEKVKKDLPELVEVFNKAKPEEVLGKAEQLKAQFIAGGMSSENATKKIYALIAASNDASMALSTVASGGFQAITDKSSATNVSIATFNKLLSEGNTDQIYAAFETANISAQALEKSLIGTKNAQGEIIDEAGAYEETYNRIANSAGGNKEIGEETLRAFISQNKELEKVLNATDTLEGSFAKLKLYSLGIREDLATMNSDLAETLALVATQQAGILGSNTGPFKELVKLIEKQDAAAKASAATAKKLAKATKEQIQSEIDKRRENIEAIKKEADERKKALDEELADSDRLVAIQKAQIEYQNALASGDFTTAAQAQLDIQSLVQEQQTELAKRAIDDRAAALIAPEDARIKALETQLKGLDDQITSANNAATKTMDNVNKLRETLSGLITFTISATADGAIDASEAGVLRGIQTSLKNLGLNKLASGLGLQVTEYGRNMKGSPGPSDINNIYEYGILSKGADSFTAAFNSVKEGANLRVNVKNLSELKAAMSGGKTETVNPVILLPGTAVQGTATGGLNEAAAKAKSGVFNYKGKEYNKESTGTGFYGTGMEDRKFWYIQKADGGYIKNFAPGGGVNGPGTATSDSIPAMLSDGEWVIKADSVKKAEQTFGPSFLHDLNAGRFAEGGKVGKLGTADSMIRAAESMLGYQEGRGNNTIFGNFAQKAYGLQSRFIAWCGAFINWVAKKSGVDLSSMVWTPGGAQSFMKSGKWTTMNPVRGDLAFMDFPGDGLNRISHVGLVRNVLSRNSVSTIEGNTSGSGSQRSGGGVLAKIRQYNTKNAPIVGFGRPSYKPVDAIKYGYGTEEYYSADDAKSDYENSRYTVTRGDTLSSIANKYGVTVKQLMAMNPQLNDPKYMGGSRIFSGTKVNIKKFAEGGKVTSSLTNAGTWIKGPLTTPRQRKPGVPYSRSGAPIGNPFGQYWGELSRFTGPRSPGMDIWGGTEIPGLKFSGEVPQHSDYMHQMLEQPRKPSNGPGMGIDKDPMRYAGSGASMGGIGNGAYGLGPLMFANGGPVQKFFQGGTPNMFGMGMDWFGKTLFKSGNSVVKNVLGFDVTKPFGKKSIMEKISMALMPFGGAGSSGAKGAAKLPGAISNFTSEMKSFHMSDIDAKAMQALSNIDLSSIKIPSTGISFNPGSANVALEALKRGESPGATAWEIVQAQRETLLKNKYPKIDFSDVAKFNEYYAKEFYGLLPDDAIKLFKGVRSTVGSSWRTGEKDLATYFSTNPHIAALYSLMIGKAKLGDELPMFGIDRKISDLRNFLGEGAVRNSNAQGSMEFPQLLGGKDLSDVLPSIYSLPGQVYGQMFGATATSLTKIKNLWPSGFANGGPVGGAPHALGMSSMGQGGAKKQNWFQKYVSNLTKAHDSNPAWARDPLGSVALLRKFAGQSRKGDTLNAALMPLNFMGLGLGARAGIGGAGAASAVNMGTASTLISDLTSSMRSSKASKTIIRNLQKKAMEFAEARGAAMPEMILDGGHESYVDAPTSFFRAPGTDLSRAYNYYWGQAWEILNKQNDPAIKDVSKEHFMTMLGLIGKGQVSRSETAQTVATDFSRAANKAYAQAHGLDPNQKVALYKSTELFDKLGGYFSLSSKMAAHYGGEQHLNLLGSKSGKFGSNAGLYKIDVLPEDIPTPLSIGGMFDEFTATLPPELVEKLGGATRVALAGKPRKVGPQRANTLDEFYSKVPGAKIPDGMKPWDLDAIMKADLFGRNAPYVSSTNDLVKKLLESGAIVKKFANGGMAQIPKFAGGGLVSTILSKAKSLAHKPINLLNQYMNYFKAKKMLKNGMYHGSADLGRNSDGPFGGVTELSGDYARDPYYGMGFYGTSSKAEADLYAGGYNVPGQWGESYGSLNKITKIPFGRYLDFSKDLKNQNYALWKLFGERGFMGAGENLGPLMNKAGMTGSIMPRISAGQTGDVSMDMAKWIALNKPKGTVLKEVGMGFANGGMVGPKYNIPTTSSSIVNPQPMRYNNGGAVHKYDVGGLVVNAAPGQSEREIASMVVQMLDNKNMLDAAKSGGRGRT